MTRREYQIFEKYQLELLRKKYNGLGALCIFLGWSKRDLAYITKFRRMHEKKRAFNLLTTTINPIDRNPMTDYFTYNVDSKTGNPL